MIAVDPKLQNLFNVLETAHYKNDQPACLNYVMHLGRAIRKRAAKQDMEWVDLELDGKPFTKDDYTDLLMGSFQGTWARMEAAYDEYDDHRNAIESGVGACIEMLNIADAELPEYKGMLEPPIRDRMLHLYGVFLDHLEEKSQNNYVVMPQEIASFQDFGDELETLFGEDFKGWNANTHTTNTIRMWANLYAYQIGYEQYQAIAARTVNTVSDHFYAACASFTEIKSHPVQTAGIIIKSALGIAFEVGKAMTGETVRQIDMHLDTACQLREEVKEQPLIAAHPTASRMLDQLSTTLENYEDALATRAYRGWYGQTRRFKI